MRLEQALQHKRCAELLRAIYEALLDNKETTTLQELYHTLTEWMQLSPLALFTLKNVADQYHVHLAKANIVLKEHNLLPPIRRGDREPKLEFGTCHIYLDNLRSAYNVGSILRTTEALRLGPVYFGGNTPNRSNPKVQKTSMGSWEMIPSFEKPDIESLPAPIIILDTAKEAIPIHDFIFPDLFTLIVGNEEFGVSDAILKKGMQCIDIPLFGRKNSINVACAFGICAQEIRKQWNKKTTSSFS